MKQVENVELKKFLEENVTLTERALYQVPLNALMPDPEQPRKNFDAELLAELKASIEKHGVLQPVIFRKDADDSLIIISGERRYKASQLAQKQSIPGIYNTSGNATEIALVENSQRENLNPMETAEALKRLKDEKSYTNVEISAAIGKVESTICEILSLNRLPEAIKAECRVDGNISRRVLVEIAKADSEDAMETLFEKYKKKELTREEARVARVEKKVKVEDWKKKVDGFGKQIGKIDFEKLGDQSRPVETALKGLVVMIEGMLPVAE